LETACQDTTSFAELRVLSLADRLLAQLAPEQARSLRELAPDTLTLPGGRRLSIEYPAGQPPWVASRLQDFFGLAEGPRIAADRVPLTLHLLAPNRRAVQVTSDLAGFWQRHYPHLRRELMRRYPKHDWPDDGAAARPPPPGRLRSSR
jgi:ATP-dependent helicase HrpB